MKSSSSTWCLALVIITLLSAYATAADDKAPWWSADVEQALGRAAANRGELLKALSGTPVDQRKGMSFLIANMPENDLKSLRADFLLENVSLAYKVRQDMPWSRQIPEDIFLNDILPYANVDEARDPWRKELYDLCLPLVKDCKTPAEAAHKLNSTIFTTLKAHYSTERKKPNQSPKETIAQGKATCSGLSILLADACRSVGVPARLAGTPMWTDRRGNHTWVEVWDNGWHFTGADEPDKRGLDHGWFEDAAGQAKSVPPENGIYAVSFRKTKVLFPMVWAPESKDVHAEDVTARYARAVKRPENKTNVLIRVWEAGKTRRVALPVLVIDADKTANICRGDSRGDKSDLNDILTIELLADHDYIVRIGMPVRVEKAFHTVAGKTQTLDIEITADQTAKPASDLTPEQTQQLDKAARDWFRASDEERTKLHFAENLDALLGQKEAAVRQVVWKAYQAVSVPADVKKDFEENRVHFKEYVSPYKVRKVGTKPANGWPLVIAMHGGGNAPQELNDSQWKMMETYYKDQIAGPGYLYLALRAPNNTWNGFYDNYVPPLIINLIRQFTTLGEVDCNKVFLIGYSHGGYGAFFIGPKIPDRFAAVHCSASAPTDGTISALTLRTTRFTFMVGDADTAYGRRKHCEKFAAVVAGLKQESPGDFPVEFELKKGFGHGGLPDRDKLKEMLPFVRKATPLHLTWEPTDDVVKDFFWLAVEHPEKGQKIDAQIDANKVTVTTKNVKQVDLLLDGRLVDLKKPVTIVLDGKTQEKKLQPSLLTLCQTLSKRGDPELAASCQVRLEPGK